MPTSLVKRRDKIGRVYFSRINPLVRFALSDSGVLTFENPGREAGFEPKQGYEAAWARLRQRPASAADRTAGGSDAERFQAPAAFRRGDQLRQGLDPRDRAAARAVVGAGGRLFPTDGRRMAARRCRAIQRRIVGVGARRARPDQLKEADQLPTPNSQLQNVLRRIRSG